MSNPRTDLATNAPEDKGESLTVGVSELLGTIADVMNTVHYAGRRYVVTRHGKPIAMIVPIGERGVDAA